MVKARAFHSSEHGGQNSMRIGRPESSQLATSAASDPEHDATLAPSAVLPSEGPPSHVSTSSPIVADCSWIVLLMRRTLAEPTEPFEEDLDSEPELLTYEHLKALRSNLSDA